VDDQTTEPWDVLHRWEWFRRSQWLSSFRERKRPITEAVAALLRERGCADGTLLDCSCGLGLHTIPLHELGLRVQATWQQLAADTTERFDAIFCDALSWVRTQSDFEAALDGFRSALRPGGVVLFLGAPEGVSVDQGRRLLLERFKTSARHSLEWHHSEAGVTCTKLSCAELGEDFLDRHHLFLIEEADARRLDAVIIRESVQWSWDRLVDLFTKAGFRDLHTYGVRQWSSRGTSERPIKSSMSF
jgi:hypothetical protein